MVAMSCEVMTAFSGGREASKAADRSSIPSRCCCIVRKVETEFVSPSTIFSRTRISTRWRTSSNVENVRRAEISTRANRNLDRSDPPSMVLLNLRHEFIPGIVDRHKMNRAGRILLQLLAEVQDVGIHRTRGRIGVVTPYVVQELIAGNNPLRILREILQQFQLLRGHGDRAIAADHFHLQEIHR